jgi:hypothetical protein
MLTCRIMLDSSRYDVEVEERTDDEGEKQLAGKFVEKPPPAKFHDRVFALDSVKAGKHHVCGQVKLAADGTFAGVGPYLFNVTEPAKV